jgi:quaternary ammonium compound-resistance protein SugE
MADDGPGSRPGRFVFAAGQHDEESEMAWIYLLVAGVFEIGFAMGLKYTEGFTRLWPSVGTMAAAGASLWLMTQAMKGIPVGTAYAVWTGIGATGVAVVGMALFAEPASPARLACIGLIVAGVIGLKLAS